MKLKLMFVLSLGCLLMLFPFQAGAAQASLNTEGLWFFEETFADKSLRNNQIVDKNNRVIWEINTAEGQSNAITDTGALELGGARYMQRAVLVDRGLSEKQNYAMEFTINVKKLGNEGHSGRPVAIIVPRAKDKNFKEYYAVTYYMENSVANQFKFKWAIINTAAPTKMEPLVTGYYLLRENVDYTARLVIQNTVDGKVEIRFYIDGPINPVKKYEPLLKYVDDTEYKILSGVTGPALGTVGYADSGWGTSPVVHYDNVRMYHLNEYKKYEEQLKKYALVNPRDIASDKEYGQIKYLINRGILAGYPDNSFRSKEAVSTAQFLKMLISLKGESYSAGPLHWAENYINRALELGIIKEGEFPDINKPLTRFEAALLITRFYGNPTGDENFYKFIRDNSSVPEIYRNSVIFTFQEGYLRLNDDFKFMGDQLVCRSDIATILLRMLDANYRIVNYELELPHIFSSGAVFQGNKKIPLWGRGITGDTIKVKFKDQVKTTLVKDGHWYLELDPEPYGGPYTLTISSSMNTIRLQDIQVGEVFIVAGQSNAEWFLKDSYGFEETLRKFKDKQNLRFYFNEKTTAVRPNFTVPGRWNIAYDWVLSDSPAIGTFFVEKLLELNKGLAGVTIGVIKMSYGGTTIEAFMPDSVLREKNYTPKDSEPIMAGFWNGFMEPIVPYSARGVLYYQGENSAHLGYKYEPLLRDYIRGLRNEFKDPDLPVILVQLAGYGYNHYEGDIDEWPIIREIQWKVANTTANTGLVTAVDLGDADPLEIHPREKKEVGQRLANFAMNLFYGQPIERRSTELKSCRFEGNKAIVELNYDFGRIYFKDGSPGDVQILDSQGVWHRAEAEINKDSNSLTIWSEEVPEPQGVRYAWVNYPNIGIYNGVDYPVLPFKFVRIPKNTGAKNIKLPNHMLKTNDAIVNSSRQNHFRTVVVLDSDNLSHVYAIPGQSAGDTILKFSLFRSYTAQGGTSETKIVIPKHGLSVGDWIRNNTRRWEARRVIAVLDENTILVDKIAGQRAGDDIGGYRYIGKSLAK